MALSSDLDFEDFLRRRHPLSVMRERIVPPDAALDARAYDDTTDALLNAIQSGSRTRLEAAVNSLELAS